MPVCIWLHVCCNHFLISWQTATRSDRSVGTMTFSMFHDKGLLRGEGSLPSPAERHCHTALDELSERSRAKYGGYGGYRGYMGYEGYGGYVGC